MTLADASPGVWITRAAPGAADTARHVAALGLTPIVAPLLTFRPLATDVTLGEDEALAFTSANGVACATALIERRDMPVFAVGDVTAEAASAAGFVDVTSAGGDVRALAALVARARPQRPILHPCATETAGDLVGMLSAAGVAARKIAVYETITADALPPKVQVLLEQDHIAAALFHSPKAGRVANTVLGALQSRLRSVAALGLSQACVDPLQQAGFGAVVVAAKPTEAALMQTLEMASKAWPHG